MLAGIDELELEPDSDAGLELELDDDDGVGELELDRLCVLEERRLELFVDLVDDAVLVLAAPTPSPSSDVVIVDSVGLDDVDESSSSPSELVRDAEDVDVGAKRVWLDVSVGVEDAREFLSIVVNSCEVGSPPFLSVERSVGEVLVADGAREF